MLGFTRWMATISLILKYKKSSINTGGSRDNDQGQTYHRTVINVTVYHALSFLNAALKEKSL